MSTTFIFSVNLSFFFKMLSTSCKPFSILNAKNMLRLTEVVKQLLIINVLFFIADALHSEGVFTIVDMDLFALFFPESDFFRPYQIVTHFFMHGGIGHLFFNMFALVMFGSALEQLWGPKRFLVFYIICCLLYTSPSPRDS